MLHAVWTLQLQIQDTFFSLSPSLSLSVSFQFHNSLQYTLTTTTIMSTYKPKFLPKQSVGVIPVPFSGGQVNNNNIVSLLVYAIGPGGS